MKAEERSSTWLWKTKKNPVSSFLGVNTNEHQILTVFPSFDFPMSLWSLDKGKYVSFASVASSLYPNLLTTSQFVGKL